MSRLSVSVAALAIVAACQSERLRVLHADAPTLRSREAAPVESLRVATFNAGLAPGMVPHAAERAPEVIAAIAEQNLNLACVQEVWLEEHWSALRAATRARLPHALRPEPRVQQRGKPCTATEIARVARCALRHCSSKPASEAAECAMKRCRQHADDLSATCIGCMARQPLRRVAEILDECVDPDRAEAERGNAQGPVFFDGSYGIGLLSSEPLSGVDRLELEAAHHPRAVLHASIGEGERRLHVFCTHLTPILGNVPHPGGGSWEGEQSRQVDAMLHWIARRAGDEPALILGDLNTGPGTALARARMPEHYERFVRQGFINPYLARGHAACTFCYDNPVTGGEGGGLLIDHVLVRGYRGRIEASRFLDGRMELDVGGHRQPSALSDHYGVLALLRPR